MINNFTKKAGLATAIALALGASTVSATIFNASASFRTIADVTITEVAALSFGTAVTGKAGTDCSLVAVITPATPASNVDANNTTTGTGCSSTDAVVAEYTIGGANGATVTILMATATDTDFTFAPAGDYSDQLAAGDTITTYFADAPFNVTLDPAAGTGMLAVGGTLTIINDLNPSQSYAVAYDISIIY
ncbi:hypothetical protein [Colwellia sp. TT2012]|uniref:hypothetical protein n=1 Tax=Colwellia sp. TT2012 TaxID=1720342 RepID=UPI00070D9AE0|nr:hypothetical protein [Colwellia sp. TT2012]